MSTEYRLDTPIDDLIEDIAARGTRAELAIGLCQLRFRESAPIFRGILERAAERGCADESEERLLFVGLHVLGAGRDAPACSALLRLLRAPDDELEWLLGDAATETLPRIMAGVFDGNADALFAALADRDIDDFVRFGLFGTLAFLTRKGHIDSARTIGFLERFDDWRLAGDSDFVWSGWAEAVALLGLRALAPRVERAWADGRLDRKLDEPGEWAEELTRAEASPGDDSRFLQLGFGYIEDVLADLRLFGGDEVDEAGHEAIPDDEHLDLFAPLQAVNEWRHVGRNDPCPCGSGRKFKQCCLGKVE